MNEFKTLPKIRISQVNLDITNPRIGKQADEKACIEAIANKNRVHMLNLIRDIASEGLTPNPIILSKNKDDEWIVRDGNRRVTALKLLKNPNLAPSDEMTKKIKEIKLKYPKYSLEIKTAHEFESEESLQKYLDKIHKGSQDGIGQIEWSTIEKARHNQQVGNKDKNIRALNFLIWAQNECNIFIDEDTFPFTTLSDRLMSVERLERIGIIADNDKAYCSPNKDLDITIKKVTRIINDLSKGEETSRTLLGAKDQDRYIDQLCSEYGEGIIESKSDTNDSTKIGSNLTNAVTNPTNKPTAPTDTLATTTYPVNNKPTWDRPKLFLKSKNPIKLPENQNKVQNILTELSKLRVDSTPIAVAMLYRALVEHSILYYINKHNLKPKKAEFVPRIRSVITHMNDNNVISEDLFELIGRYTNDDSSMLHARTLHAYVHSDVFHPDKQVLNNFWDQTSPFLVACWKD
ncbi:hypothetical protein M947_02095 [Sulfurimonas hongkongensis]|uniref:ParB/Sulfiredoxin domain-containing protein n=1 Tax=Sulfurimonas hongkongensis TaxID=1172190 RepID=T0JHM8_9BACT|nr:ParB/Srx family N-terminal domain-containing protein [Sulfurimonas hongkongensis]EQB40620.1 hypothetical protein M947_02095 [Sulfurimonas hongkongensis]